MLDNSGFDAMARVEGLKLETCELSISLAVKARPVLQDVLWRDVLDQGALKMPWV